MVNVRLQVFSRRVDTMADASMEDREFAAVYTAFIYALFAGIIVGSSRYIKDVNKWEGPAYGLIMGITLFAFFVFIQILINWWGQKPNVVKARTDKKIARRKAAEMALEGEKEDRKTAALQQQINDLKKQPVQVIVANEAQHVVPQQPTNITPQPINPYQQQQGPMP